jgi:hypothetical protein
VTDDEDADDSSEVEKYLTELAKRLEEEKGEYPEPPSRDSLLKVFREIKDEKDPDASIKLGFLSEKEIGLPKISNRDYLGIARYARTEGLEVVWEFLFGRAVDTTRTSLALKAKLLDMPGTVKRESRSRGPPKLTTKNTMFGGRTEVREGYDE